MKKIIVCAFVLLLLAINAYCQKSSALSNEISSDNLMRIVRYLSSKELSGRLPGTEGYNKAAAYIAEEFAQIKLRPIGDSAYYQFLPIECNQITGPCEFNIINNNKITKKFILGTDYIFRGFTGCGKISSDVVFCGYGISQPEINYDDFAGIDVKGKIIMIFKENPSYKPDTGKWTSSSDRYKAAVAAKHGAIGIIYVNRPNNNISTTPTATMFHGEGTHIDNLPQVHVSLNTANELLKNSNTSLTELSEQLKKNKRPNSFSLKTTVEIEVHTSYNPQARTMNVAAIIPGTDSLLKNEYVIIGAHLDHLGSQCGEIYYPGAMDNASGSAAVVEIARAVKRNPPKRSVVFVCFAGEEQGIFGAHWFAEHSPVPLDKTIAMLNLDCIAYGDSIKVGKRIALPNMWNFIKSIDSQLCNIIASDAWEGGGGADAAPFLHYKIPSVYIGNFGDRKTLHATTDTPETINVNMFSCTTNLFYHAIIQIANGYYIPDVVPEYNFFDEYR